MIRINLLEVPKPKSKRSAIAMPSIEVGNFGTPLVKVAAVLGLAAVLNAGYWYRLDAQKRSIESQMTVAEQKNRELADVKARYLARQREADNYKRRVDVIEQLHKSQTGEPVNLMAMVGETVNNTEAVWLNNIKDQGPNVDIEGTALSSDAVANLISNLQKTGYFKNIEVKESVQDEQIKDMQAFQFTLTCERGKS